MNDKRKGLKKLCCLIVAMICMMSMGVVTYASTIEFVVCVYGSNADTMSKREKKSSDGDNNAYFTGVYYDEGYAPVSVSSYKLDDKSLYSGTATIKTSNLGHTLKRAYNRMAPGGEYYYMDASNMADYGRTTLHGRYCP